MLFPYQDVLNKIEKSLRKTYPTLLVEIIDVPTLLRERGVYTSVRYFLDNQKVKVVELSWVANGITSYRDEIMIIVSDYGREWTTPSIPVLSIGEILKELRKQFKRIDRE